MACMEHVCQSCRNHFMDNKKYDVCPICKSSDITNWFDEEEELISLQELESEDGE